MAGGQQATIEQGTLTARTAGPGMTFYQGVLVAAADDVTVNITGEEVAFEQGVMLPALPLAGQSSTPGLGVVGPNITVALTGIGGTLQQGLLGVNLEVDDTFSSFSQGLVGSGLSVAAVGIGATPAQGFVNSNPQLLGQLILAQHYNIFAYHERALIGSQAAFGQGLLGTTGGTPAVDARRRGGAGWWPGGGRSKKTLRDKLDERLRDLEEELLLQLPATAKTPIFQSPVAHTTYKELQAQVVDAVMRDRRKHADRPIEDDEDEIIEAAAHAMMLLLKKRAK